ncbi:hypothetical protein FQR65_LT15338 [Abscondita terminalis]|nr:hypothetical protein FQR65_LT15338 [Abscondita terminalis]
MHPDLNPDDKEAHHKFQELNEANEVLSDPDRKRANPCLEVAEVDLVHHPEEEAQGKFKGQDLHAELQLSLHEAAETHQRTLDVNSKKVRITIPAGVYDGQQIKLKGYGMEGHNGGPSGDLYITFIIPEDSHLKRSGDDLKTTVIIDMYYCFIGGDVEVKTLNGSVKLKVKPETANASTVRLKGKGFPVYKKEGQSGDLYVTFNVQLPKNLTDKQKELLKEMQKS